MRKIKFRAWDGEKMLYRGFGLFKHQNDGTYHAYINQTMINELILMQYTGLKDKNGKEIYEGDRVSCKYKGEHKACDNEDEPIVYKGTQFTVEYSTQALSTHIEIGGEFEIIGNIYEEQT